MATTYDDFNDDQNDSQEEDEFEQNENIIFAQYRAENRVRSTFKFHLVNVVMFLDGNHYFAKELKASIQFWMEWIRFYTLLLQLEHKYN